MSAERKKVLEMLREGKITADEAEKLLDKLTASGSDSAAAKEQAGDDSTAQPKKQRYLRIVVDKPPGDQVNVRVPLSFMRRGAGLLAVLPQRVSEKLGEHGIDLTAFAGMKEEDLSEVLRELNIDVEKGEGKKVRIFCE